MHGIGYPQNSNWCGHQQQLLGAILRCFYFVLHTNYGMRHRSYCRRRTRNAAVSVTVGLSHTISDKDICQKCIFFWNLMYLSSHWVVTVGILQGHLGYKKTSMLLLPGGKKLMIYYTTILTKCQSLMDTLTEIDYIFKYFQNLYLNSN